HIRNLPGAVAEDRRRLGRVHDGKSGAALASAGGRLGRGGCQPVVHASSPSISPSRYALAASRRWILPLEVRGRAPVRKNRISISSIDQAPITARRIRLRAASASILAPRRRNSISRAAFPVVIPSSITAAAAIALSSGSCS